jgi:hypothetical protein
VHQAGQQCGAPSDRAGLLGPGSVGGEPGEVGPPDLLADVGGQCARDHHQPLVLGGDSLAAARPAGNLAPRINTAPAIGIDAGVDRTAQHPLQGGTGGTPEDNLALVRSGSGPHGQVNGIVDEIAQYSVERAEFGELREDQSDHGLDLLVRVQDGLARGTAQISHRQGERQLAAAGLVDLPGLHPLLDQMEFNF